MLGFSSDAISRMKRQSRLLTTYVIGQGGAQFLQLVTGFIVIRWLSKEAYADYTIINTILGMGSMLFGLGISQCLTGLIGKKHHRFGACRAFCLRSIQFEESGDGRWDRPIDDCILCAFQKV